MIHLGIDLHKSFSYFFAINSETGETKSEELPNDEVTIRRYVQGFDEPIQAVVEATWNWEWLVDLLLEEGVDVKLANPLQIKMTAYARVKSDKVDAKMLAKLLAADLIPESYIPTKEERARRKLVRNRVELLRERTSIKNHIHSRLAHLNLYFPASNTFGVRGREWLRNLKLPSPEALIVREALDRVDLLDRQIGARDKEFVKWIDKYTEVKLLQTVPGIGPTISALIFTETCNTERFQNAKKYVSYCGLIPVVRSSGEKTYYGRLPKQANLNLKYAYNEAAMLITRFNPAWRKKKKELLEKKGRGTARIIIARKIADCCYKMLRYGTEYREMLSKGYLNL